MATLSHSVKQPGHNNTIERLDVGVDVCVRWGVILIM